LQGLFVQAGLQEGWVGGIVDRKGILVARSLRSETFVGRPAKPSVVAVAQGHDPMGLFENTSHEGVLMENAFRRSNSGWTAYVAVPATVLHAPFWRTALMIMLIGLALTLAGLAIGIMIARRIAREIHQIGYASVAVAAGDKIHLPTSTIAELQDVSRSLELTSAHKA
jgi:HAMP domain-containing protein